MFEIGALIHNNVFTKRDLGKSKQTKAKQEKVFLRQEHWPRHASTFHNQNWRVIQKSSGQWFRGKRTGFMTGTGTPNCPVASSTKFISKLHPDRTRLWCYGWDAYHPNDMCGIKKKNTEGSRNALAHFLPEPRQRCNLFRADTNHCIQAITTTVLHQ